MNINEFKAELVGGGARPNLYKITVPFPVFAGDSQNTKRLAFLCKGAQIPQSTINAIEVPFRGRFLKVAGDRVFPEWTITVFNDTSFGVRNAFEKWSNGINEHVNNIGLSPVEYMVDIEIQQLDRNEEVIKEYTMYGAWPSEVSPIELAWDANDQIEEYTVNLQFQYWSAEGITT